MVDSKCPLIMIIIHSKGFLQYIFGLDAKNMVGIDNLAVILTHAVCFQIYLLFGFSLAIKPG